MDRLKNSLLLFVAIIPLMLPQQPAIAVEPHVGVLIEVPLPFSDGDSLRLVDELKSLAGKVLPDAERLTVILKIGGRGGGDTRFEPALYLARWLTSPAASSLRSVAWLDGEAEGHAALIVLACEQLIATEQARLGPVSVAEDAADEAVGLFYQNIAEKRAKIPVDAVRGLLNPSLEIVALGRVDGSWEIATGDRLAQLRASGETWNEVPLSSAGKPLIIDGNRLRDLRWASHLAVDQKSVAEALQLADWQASTDKTDGETREGALLELSGIINNRQVAKLEKQLADASKSSNTILLQIDSPGGDLQSSLTLASHLSQLRDSGVRVAAYVPNQALADAVIIAAACEQLYVHPNAMLGGPGESTLHEDTIRELRPQFAEIMDRSGRSTTLLMGLLTPQIVVVKYVDQRTGRVQYFTEDELAGRQDHDRWERSGEAPIQDGMVGKVAMELNFVEGTPETLEGAAAAAGLESTPERLVKRDLVDWVETIGRKPWLSYFLLFVGMLALAIESGIPGVGLPGFIAVVSLGGFVWIQHLNGTAEWLEVMLLVAGLGCLALELLVLPGFGIFGFGGLVMIVTAIVLISQTFVLPQNNYQYAKTTHGLLGVLVACVGVVTGFLFLSRFMRYTPGLKNLVMDLPTSEDLRRLDQKESLAQLDDLMNQTGIAPTPLVPSGKVRVGDRTISVVTDGLALDPGTKVRVTVVQGSRVVVEPISG